MDKFTFKEEIWVEEFDIRHLFEIPIAEDRIRLGLILNAMLGLRLYHDVTGDDSIMDCYSNLEKKRIAIIAKHRIAKQEKQKTQIRDNGKVN